MNPLILATCILTALVSTGESSDIQNVAPVREYPMSGAELAIWNDPDFQRRFVDSYIAATDIEPRVTENEREQMLEILELISADDKDKAVELLRKFGTAASSAVFDFTLGNIYLQNERLDQAAANYEVAVRKYRKFRRAWKNLALVHVRRNDYEKALPALTQVIELGGGDAITYGLLGFSYSSVGNELSAESAFRMATLLDPQAMDWKMGLARSLFKQHRYADASALCEALIAAEPERADLWLLQANAFIGLEQPLKAAENFQLVDQLGKSTADSLTGLADIYVNSELFGLAVDSYRRALQMDPQGKLDRAVRAARVLTAQGALPESRQLIEAIEASCGETLEDEDKKGLLKLRARLAVAEGAGDEEASVLEQIVELDPLDGEALILLGQHSRRAENFEQAVFYFERAAGIEGFEADAKVRHGQLLVGQGKYAEALPLLRRAQDLRPRESVQKYIEQIERVSQGR